MTDTRFDFEEGIDGDTVTAALTGFTGVETTVKYSNLHPAHGSLGAAVLAPGTATGLARLALSNEPKVEVVTYVWLTAAVTTDVHLQRVTHTGDFTSGIAMVTNLGFPRLTTGSGGATTNSWTGSTAFPTGQLLRVGLYVEAGTTAITGKARLAVFAGDDVAPITGFDSTLLTGIDTAGTTAALINARTGKLSGGTYSGSLYFDDVFVRTGADADGNFDPVPGAPPPLAAGELVWTGSVWE